jgi:hypothetical protein
MAGVLPGPRIVASFIIAPLPIPLGVPGASERNSFGGMNRKRNGQGSTFRTSRKPKRPITALIKTLRETTLSRAINLSSCTPMASAGSGPPRD